MGPRERFTDLSNAAVDTSDGKTKTRRGFLKKIAKGSVALAMAELLGRATNEEVKAAQCDYSTCKTHSATCDYRRCPDGSYVRSGYAYSCEYTYGYNGNPNYCDYSYLCYGPVCTDLYYKPDVCPPGTCFTPSQQE